MAVVAILGCGPAGLFAAQAVKMCGFQPVIMSRKVKSPIYGAQYLHRPIPGISSQTPTGVIHTIRVGRAEAYAERVYGLGTHPTSWERVVPLAPAWDLRESYDRAWEEFENQIADVTIGPDDVSEFTSQFDLVISTIPAWSICLTPSQHYFSSLPILVKKNLHLSSPEDWDVEVPEQQIGDNWVIYNGTHQHAWYRASNIFGHISAEARPASHLESNKEWEVGFKVVGSDCNCHPTVVKAGRMGLWKAGVLTHNAFDSTIEGIVDQFGSVHINSLG